LNRRDRQLDGKLLTVSSQARHLDSPAYNFSLAALEIPSKSLSVGFAVSLRDYEVGHNPSNRLFSRPSKDGHGVIAPISHAAIGLHDHHRIKGGFQYQAQAISLWR
jgi:hypothetical protein